jgi:hypothetical protein
MVKRWRGVTCLHVLVWVNVAVDVCDWVWM